jgi:hypothetical protein
MWLAMEKKNMMMMMMMMMMTTMLNDFYISLVTEWNENIQVLLPCRYFVLLDPRLLQPNHKSKPSAKES